MAANPPCDLATVRKCPSCLLFVMLRGIGPEDATSQMALGGRCTMSCKKSIQMPDGIVRKSGTQTRTLRFHISFLQDWTVRSGEEPRSQRAADRALRHESCMIVFQFSMYLLATKKTDLAVVLVLTINKTPRVENPIAHLAWLP